MNGSSRIWTACLVVVVAGAAAVSIRGNAPDGQENRESGTEKKAGVEISVDGGAVKVVTNDLDVEVTVTDGGESVRIFDRKTSEDIRLNTDDFALELGEETTRLRFSGRKLELTRAGETIATVTRRDGADRQTHRFPGELRRFEGHVQQVNSVDFSPDGRYVVSGSRDGTVRVWNVAEGRQKRWFRMLKRGHGSRYVGAVAFSPNGRKVAAGGANERIHVWDIKSGREVARLSGHDNFIRDLAFLPDGRLLAGDHDGIVRLWDVETGEELRTYHQPMDRITDLAVSANGRRAVCSGGYLHDSNTPLEARVRVWDLKTDESLFEIEAERRGHTGSEVTLSPDGRRVITGTTRNNLRCLGVWDVESEQFMYCLTDQTSVTSFEYAASGTRFITSNHDGTVRVFDMETGGQISLLQGHIGHVNTAAFSPDGRRAVSGGNDGTVRVWKLPISEPSRDSDATTSTNTRDPIPAGETQSEHTPQPGEEGPAVATPVAPLLEDATVGEVHRFERHDGRVLSVAFSPEGRRIASAGNAGTVRVWDVVTGRQLHNVDPDLHQIYDVVFTPDGKRLLFGAVDGAAHLWDLQTGREVRHFEHGSYTSAVAVSPDGRHVLTAGSDDTVHLWETETGRRIRSYQQPMQFVRSIAFALGGRRILAAGGYSGGNDPRAKPLVHLWDLESGETVFEYEYTPHTWLPDAAISPDGRFVLCSDLRKRQHMAVWDVRRNHRLPLFHEIRKPRSIVFSPNGRYVLTGHMDGTVRLSEFQTRRLLKAFRGHREHVTSVDFSPDGRLAVSGSWDETVRVWKLPVPEQSRDTRDKESPEETAPRHTSETDGREPAVAITPAAPPSLNEAVVGEVRHFEPQQSRIRSVAFAPGGRRLASAGNEGIVYVWDVAAGRETHRIDPDLRQVYDVAFTPDGEGLVFGAVDEAAHLWDLQANQEIRRFDHGSFVFALAVSPDGRHLLTAGPDKTVHMWELATGRTIRSFPQPMQFVKKVAFSEQGRRILGVGGYSIGGEPSGTKPLVRLWDLESDRTVFTYDYTPHTALPDAALSPDGRFVVATDLHSSDRLAAWDVESGDRLGLFPEVHHVRSVAFSPDGHYVLTGHMDGTVRLSEFESRKLVKTFEGHASGHADCVAYSPNGRFAASGGRDETVRLWKLPASVHPKSLPADSRRYPAVARPPDVLPLAQEPVGEARRLEGHDGPVRTAVFGPGGRRIASAAWDGTVRLWTVAAGREKQRIEPGPRQIHDVAFTPDGEKLVFGDEDGVARLWDLKSNREIRRFDHGRAVWTVAVSPDGDYCLTAGHDDEVRLWDLATGRAIRSYEQPMSLIRHVAFAKGGRWILGAGGYPNIGEPPLKKPMVHLFGLKTGETIYRDAQTANTSLPDAALSPNARHLVAASGPEKKFLRMRDLRRNRVSTFTNLNPPRSMAFSPDGRYLISGHHDGAARLLEFESREVLETFRGHRGTVNSVDYGPDGHFTVSGGRDKTVRVWKLPATARHPSNVPGR